MGEGEKFEGTFTPQEATSGCGSIPASEGTQEYKFNTNHMKGEV
jgi:hypothetical protein